MSDIIKTQRSLATKAKHNPQHQFDHLYRLICREDWIRTALEFVLSNKGAKTAGIDGVTKRQLASITAKAEFVSELQSELRSKQFKPKPVRRVYIPKAKGKRRPLGIATLKDRVVQMLLKMVLEPIWESEFLNCSNGFRPGRRTQDCIALMDSYINKRNKYFWVIEGDIKGAFDNIHHEILLKLVADKVVDKRLLKLIGRFLKAGMMQGALFQRTDIGTPQGAICSPLLANIYLHQLDKYWWNKYGSLDRKQKEKRRTQRLGNCALIRYADDWLLLTNGGKTEALQLRDEFQTFLKEELKLELNIEKTRVTHVNNGFDFLGFHVRRYVSTHDKPKLLVTPTEDAKERLKAKVKEMTKRKWFKDSPLLKFTAINAVLRGWIGYYCHCNAKKTAKNLDFWVNERLFLWLQKRHRLPPSKIIKTYKMRQVHKTGQRDNWGIRNGDDYLYLYRMSDKPITKYRSRSVPNPYLSGEESTTLTTPEVPIKESVWLGNAENYEWRELKEEILAEHGVKCTVCGCTQELDLHHIKARRIGGTDNKENLQLLCRSCHAQTSSFGNHARLLPMESEVTGNCHASFGERDRETRKLQDLKVRSVPTLFSPLLANIALHGMEERIKQYADTLPRNSGLGKPDNRRSLSLIRYADDFVILHENITVVTRCKEIISEWLQGMSLELKPSKTRLAHTLIQYELLKPGFNFLGFTIQQFPQGKYHSKQGFKTIIIPSKQKQKVHYEQIALVIEAHKAAPQAALISHLNPIIRGWANYYATVVSKVAYSDIDDLTYQKLSAWAKRRHPRKNGEWVSKRYWQSIGGDNWVFATNKSGVTPLRLLNHADTPIVRHVKVKGESSPYDGNLVYWSTRMGNNPEMPNRISKLLKKQKGKCTHCKMFFREDDVMEVDHIIPKSKGGLDEYKNLQLLHRHCHDTKTANDSCPGTKSGCNSAEPKPTRKLERVEDKWVMRYV